MGATVKRGQRRAFRQDTKRRKTQRRRITVDDLLKNCGPTWCPFNHAHHDDDGLPMTCMDCGEPCHYSYDGEEYLHDDPTVPACFLIGG